MASGNGHGLQLAGRLMLPLVPHNLTIQYVRFEEKKQEKQTKSSGVP